MLMRPSGCSCQPSFQVIADEALRQSFSGYDDSSDLSRNRCFVYDDYGQIGSSWHMKMTYTRIECTIDGKLDISTKRRGVSYTPCMSGR